MKIMGVSGLSSGQVSSTSGYPLRSLVIVSGLVIFASIPVIYLSFRIDVCDAEVLSFLITKNPKKTFHTNAKMEIVRLDNSTLISTLVMY